MDEHLSLLPFTALAITTVSPTEQDLGYRRDRLITGIAFLSYSLVADGPRFGLATRVLAPGEGESVIYRWRQANLPSGLLAGWDLKRRFQYFPDVPTASLAQLHRTERRTRGDRLIDLHVYREIGDDFAQTCTKAGIRADQRSADEQLDDWRQARTGIASASVAADALATFRLAVVFATRELRGGDGLRRRIETELGKRLRASGAELLDVNRA